MYGALICRSSSESGQPDVCSSSLRLVREGRVITTVSHYVMLSVKILRDDDA
jgi:hypothetical protein